MLEIQLLWVVQWPSVSGFASDAWRRVTLSETARGRLGAGAVTTTVTEKENAVNGGSLAAPNGLLSPVQALTCAADARPLSRALPNRMGLKPTHN